MSAKNGTEMLLYCAVSSALSPVAGLTGNEFKMDGAPIDVTTKDSLGWEENIMGKKSFTFSADGVFDDAATFGFNDLEDIFDAGLPVTVRMSTEVSGEHYREGSVLITSLALTAPVEDKVTFKAEFRGTGAPTHTTV